MTQRNWTEIVSKRFKREKKQSNGEIKCFNIYWLGSEDVNSSNIIQTIEAVLQHQKERQLIQGILKLYLGCNSLASEGCLKLSHLQFNNLTWLSLSHNNIKSDGCLYLSKANWNNLKFLDLDDNQIQYQGCRYLALCQWKNFYKLNIKGNRICKQGYLILINKNWKIICDPQHIPIHHQ